MQITKQTLDILKNFSQINSSLLIKVGSELETISAFKNILARSGVVEEFTQRCGIYDLPRLLKLISSTPMKNMEVEFGEEYLTLSNEKTSLKYHYADENTIISPTKRLNMPDDAEIKFVLDETDLDSILSISKLLDTSPNKNSLDLAITSDGETISMTVLDKRNPVADSCELTIGQGNGDTYSIYFKIENIRKILKGSYDVTISTKGISHFAHQELDLEYWIAAEPSIDQATTMFNGKTATMFNGKAA